jgi:hypothetical protein
MFFGHRQGSLPQIEMRFSFDFAPTNHGIEMSIRPSRRKFALIYCLLCLFCWTDHSAASDATQQLQSAVRRLNTRLAAGNQGEGWRRYLQLNILETQAAKGEQADIATLQSLHSRFASGAPGLDHPIFADVREALQRQISILGASYVGDLNQAVARAASQFQPITVGQMMAYRDLVKREVEALQYYYRTAVPSDKRAAVFADLDLDGLVAFLDEVEFELAPEVSVGKIDSAIRQARQQLDAVIRKIDALPIGETPDPNTGGEEGQRSPTPDDNQESLQDLERKQAVLEERIAELQEQRAEVRRQDLPRIRRRAQTFRRLRDFELNFDKAARDVGDPYFVSTRLAHERFVRAFLYGTDDNLQEDFLLRIQRLAEEVPKLQSASDRQAAGVVGNTLEWLENAFQVPHLVTAIRNRYSLPNAYVNISSNFINRVGVQTLNETQPVNETLLGRLVQGCATTVGNVTFDFQDDPNQVHLSLHLNATVNSNTYTQQGRITAYINSTGLAEFRRSLYANWGGFYADGAYGGANVNSCFGGTSCSLRLVDRIGQRQFDKSKRQGEAEGARRIEAETYQRFTQQTDEALRQGKEQLSKSKQNLIDKSNLIPEIYLRSKPDKVMAVAKGANKANLAAPNYPTQHGFVPDVSVQVNDTILSNFVDPIFRGKTYSDEELADELESLLGERPEALTPKEDAEEDQSFSITFTNIRPIQFEFEDGRLSVVISGREFSQGDTNIEEGLKITVRFRIINVGGKLKLVRDGDAEIDYVDPEDVSARTVAFRSFLDGRLNPEDKEDQMEVDLPDNLIPMEQVPALKENEVVRQLRLSQFRVEGGWLYAGWNYVAPGVFTSMVIDTPAIENIPLATQPLSSPMPSNNGIYVPSSEFIAPASSYPATQW